MIYWEIYEPVCFGDCWRVGRTYDTIPGNPDHTQWGFNTEIDSYWDTKQDAINRCNKLNEGDKQKIL